VPGYFVGVGPRADPWVASYGTIRPHPTVPIPIDTQANRRSSALRRRGVRECLCLDSLYLHPARRFHAASGTSLLHPFLLVHCYPEDDQGDPRHLGEVRYLSQDHDADQGR
jgi:hypothetical protein